MNSNRSNHKQLSDLKQLCEQKDIKYISAEDYTRGFVNDTTLTENLDKLEYILQGREKIVIIQDENMSICERFHGRFIECLRKYKQQFLFFVEGQNLYFPCKYYQHRNFWIELANLNINRKLIDHNRLKSKDFLLLAGTDDITRVNLVKSLAQQDILQQSLVSFNSPVYEKIFEMDKKFDWPDFDLNSDRYGEKAKIPFPLQYEETKFSIVMETVSGQGSFQMSEKTAKPIIAGHPFVVFAQPGFLGYLKEIGFKTFEDHIDESYDQEQNLEKRIEKLVQLCDSLKAIDYKMFYERTEHIRSHNQRVFFDMDKLKNITNDALEKIRHFLCT